MLTSFFDADPALIVALGDVSTSSSLLDPCRASFDVTFIFVMDVSGKEVRLALPALFVRCKDGDRVVFEDGRDDGRDEADSDTALSAVDMLSRAI